MQNHCRIPWDTEQQRLELSDYYDFSASYADFPASSASRKQKQKAQADQEWEDLSDAEDAEMDDDAEVVYEDESESEDEELPSNGLRFGDTEFELILPSGRRIGHRALRYIYKQNLM